MNELESNQGNESLCHAKQSRMLWNRAKMLCLLTGYCPPTRTFPSLVEQLETLTRTVADHHNHHHHGLLELRTITLYVTKLHSPQYSVGETDNKVKSN